MNLRWRRLLARLLLRPLAPGYSWCTRCLIPWRFIDGHETPYRSGSLDAQTPDGMVVFGVGFWQSACFPLCHPCWAELVTPEARLPYYAEMWENWQASAIRRNPEPGELADLDGKWVEIREAVLAGR